MMTWHVFLTIVMPSLTILHVLQECPLTWPTCGGSSVSIVRLFLTIVMPSLTILHVLQECPLTWPTCGGCSVGIVRLRTKGHGVVVVIVVVECQIFCLVIVVVECQIFCLSYVLCGILGDDGDICVMSMLFYRV
jgi:hypothetical protein